ncbi:MAG: hypothetical protein A07HB70_02289 [uncultured archaeon A07HB70]|nr:MAG: hypothetical protein A07HB70_02289 [uncultured archaeon A07HB70]
MSDGVGDRFHVSITTRDEGTGVEVVDHVERHRCALWTDEPVVPEPADTGVFRFPVDAAVGVRASEVTVPSVVQTYVRDAGGDMLAEVEQGGEESFGPGTYDVEVCAPMKVYLRVDGPVTVGTGPLGIRIGLDEERRVLVGGRSHHERPATTVTTTEDPRDVMRAVSTFGSALKTTSPERSYPTLRGHPPLVELGDTLDVPAGLEPPDTGITVELPPDLCDVYTAAPLAYYLGARVVPGDRPRLVATGVDRPLDRPSVERAVRETLGHVFLLDCLVRTEGYYTVDLRERRVAADRVDLDLAGLYDQPPAARLAAYLDVPHAAVADLVPDWGVTTHVEPRPEHVEMLPFLANDLATVRTPETTPRTRATAQAEAADAFFRNGEAQTRDDGGTQSYVRPESTDALEQVWVGEGVPVGASKGLPEAYHNRLERSAVEGDIDITVVCNSRAMVAESAVVDETYGSGVDLPFDVTVREQLTRAELREALASDGDFLHYVGHIDARGFDCADGWLDAETVEHVGVDAFLLNACQSFEQGAALVRAGAVAGLVTLDDVVNDAAVRMGCLLARLLNHGFPLTGALDLAGDVRPIGGQYTVVGDGTLTLARADGSPPLGPVVAALDEETYELELNVYPTRRLTTGSLINPCVAGCDEQYLFSHHIDTFELDGDELARWLELGPMPVRVDGDLWWSGDIDLDGL